MERIKVHGWRLIWNAQGTVVPDECYLRYAKVPGLLELLPLLGSLIISFEISN